MSELEGLETDVRWIKKMLENHLKDHEESGKLLQTTLVSALFGAAAGILSLIILVLQSKA